MIRIFPTDIINSPQLNHVGSIQVTSDGDAGGNNKRIARYNGQADYWWLRSPGTLVLVSYNACMAYPEGRVSNDYSGNNVGDSYGILKYSYVFPGKC